MPEYLQTTDVASEQRARATLVIAHPGHELRVHGWIETASPTVWVMTDGSGHSGSSRIDSTTRVLNATGAMPGPVYGQMSDADLYDAILSFDHQRFTNLVDQLAASLLKDRVQCVAGDAEEGYSPAHDLCRLVINAAVHLANRTSQKPIANYDFTLVGDPDRCPDALRADSLWLNLDDAALARKLSAARNYPELQAEVEAALNGNWSESLRGDSNLIERARTKIGVTNGNHFRVECLRPVNSHAVSSASFNDHAPFYEAYGERQVKAGYYKHVLRYREHMLPLAAALEAHVERRASNATA